MAAEAPQLKTRRPTGKPPWPMILLAGGEKTGKSWAAAAFSASDLIGRTFYVEIGEHYADEYGSIPGARYEIVEHDGSYRGLGQQIYAATKAPREKGRPNCIVVDSMTLLWDMLSDEAQATANARKKKGPDGEAQITMDLWNTAKKRWNSILDLLRTHDGPVILTARLEQVAVVGPGGTPTTEKTLKVKAEKNLPYEVDVIVQIPLPRKYQITGLRSVRFQLEPGAAMDAPDFTVDQLLRKLGLELEGATAPRAVTPGPTAADAADAVVRKAEREMVDIAPRGQANPLDPDFELPDTVGTASARPATNPQLQKIAILVGEKRGISGKTEEARTGRLAVLGGFVGRELGSGSELTLREAQDVIERLALEPNHVEDAVIVDDAAAAAEAAKLAATDPESDPDRIEADLLDGIESSGSPDELGAARLRAEAAQAAGAIGSAALVVLKQAADRRGDQLRADASWSHQRLAEMTGASL